MKTAGVTLRLFYQLEQCYNYLMESELRSQVERCIKELGEGTLTEASLYRILEVNGATCSQRQQLLYLQTATTSPTSAVLGMFMVPNNGFDENDSDNWPYANVLEAMEDGWRVISFPDLSLLMDENTPAGLGCNFVLEKLE